MSSRDVLPDPRPAARRADHVRREGPGHVVPADRAAAPAGRRAQRARGPHRRRGLRRPRRAFGGPCHTPTFERLAANGLQLQPLPHDGAVLADAAGAADRAQPPRRRHGRDHRDRDLGAGLQLAAPEHGRAAGRDAQAQRLLDGAVRQVPRGAGVADEPDGAVRRTGPPAAAASSTSTASSAARRTSTRRRSTTARSRSSPTARRRRATTSPRT